MEYTIQNIQQLQLAILREVIRICDENNVLYYAAYGTTLGAVRHHGFIPWDGDIDIYVPENELSHFLREMKKNLNEEFVLDFRDAKKGFRDFPRIGYKGFETGLLHVDVFRLAGAPDRLDEQKRLRKITGFLHHIINVKQKGFRTYLIQKRKVVGALVVSLLTLPIPLKVIVKIFDYFSRKYPFTESKYVGNSASGTFKSIFPKRILGNGMMVDFEDIKIRIPEYYDEYLSLMYGAYLELPPQEYREKILNKVYHEVEIQGTGLKTLVCN